MRSEKFMPELVDHQDRLQMLIEGADTVRNEEYFADLSQAEVDQKNEQFALNASELNKIELRKKEEMDKFKAEMKPLEIIYSNLLEEITLKKERRTGRLFDIIDTESSMMLTYDENGDLIASRRLRPEEKKGQSKLFIPNNRVINKAVNE